MKVKEVMTSEVKCCDLNGSVADAAKLMWDNDCGVLPVLRDGKDLVGLITDRDICMGTAMRNRNPSDISVEEVITGKVYSVMPEDDVQQALTTMQEHKVRRLPVVDAEGQLSGVLSLSDIIFADEHADGSPIAYEDIVKTYQAITEQPPPLSTAASASQ